MDYNVIESSAIFLLLKNSSHMVFARYKNDDAASDNGGE